MPNFKVITNPDGTMSTNTDFTGSKETEEKLREARASLRRMLDGGGWYEDPFAVKQEESKD